MRSYGMRRRSLSFSSLPTHFLGDLACRVCQGAMWPGERAERTGRKAARLDGWMNGSLPLEGSFLRDSEVVVGRFEPGVVLGTVLAFIGGKAIHSHDGLVSYAQ